MYTSVTLPHPKVLVGRKLRPHRGSSSTEAAEVQHASPPDRILASQQESSPETRRARCPASNHSELLHSYTLALFIDHRTTYRDASYTYTMAGSARNASPIKRLMTELQTYQNDPNDALLDLGPADDDVMQWRAVMKGVPGTAYEGMLYSYI